MRGLNVKILLPVCLILIASTIAIADDYVDGEVIVKCTEELVGFGSDPPETGNQELDAVIEEIGVTEIKEIYDFLPTGEIEDPNGKWDNNDWEAVSTAYEYGYYYLFLFDSPNYTPPDAAEELETCELVEFAEPNYICELESTFPSEEYFSYQWNFHNTGQTGGTADADIDAPEAWDDWPNYRDSIVAVVDTGVDLDHEDLEDNLVSGCNFYSPGYPPNDTDGHGTHVAGIIAAVTDNSTGVAGIGWNEIKIMPIKTIGGEYKADAYARGILWAALHGADVENFSWRTPDYGHVDVKIIHKAIQGAYNLGVVMCASKGNYYERNTSTNQHYPSDYKEVIAVTATDHNDVKPSYSNWGPDTEFCAPGGTSSVKILSTVPGDGYGYMNGTSMAAPHISAACALIQAHYICAVYPPVDRVAMARNILKNSVDDLGYSDWDEYYGWGRLNLDKLIGNLTSDRLPGPTASSVNRPSDPIGMAEASASSPLVFALAQNRPNPASGATVFKFAIPEKAGSVRVSLKVYDLAGRKVATVVDGYLPPGNYERAWDCADYDGDRLPSGVYIYLLTAGDDVASRKLVLAGQ